MHVLKNHDDEDPFISNDVYDVLEFLAEELLDLANNQDDDVARQGEAGQFEEAYRCFQRARQYESLSENAAHIAFQRHRQHEDRVPLYAGPYVPDDHPASLLNQAAWQVLADVLSVSPVWVFDCRLPLREDSDSSLTCEDEDTPRGR